jgi:multidrug efflux pump subunit AcrA (membrane-fusion protein)
VRQLEAQLAELEALAAQGAVSAREVRDLGFQLETARASLAETGASARQTRLVAPFDGVVAVRDVRVGEPAGAGKRAFQIVDLSTLRVTASLPERDVQRVAVGQRATLVAAYDDKLTAGATVSRVSPVVDANSGTFQVMLTLDAGAPLRPGQYVSVRLEVDRHAGVLVVPRGALVYDNGRPGLYRVRPAPPEAADEEGKDEKDGAEEGDEAGGGWFAGWFGGGEEPEADDDDAPAPEDEGPAEVAERVDVGVGLADALTAEILSGVSEGDRIVVVGQATLKDGARVREPKPAAPAAAPPAPPAEGATPEATP